MAKGQFSLYMLRCADGSLYTGIALDVASRIRDHESGARGAKYLRGRSPFELVFEQSMGDRSVASRAEYCVKRLTRTQKEALAAGVTSLSELLGAGEAARNQALGTGFG